MGPYVGKYYSDEWVKKKILMLTDEEIAQMDAEIRITLMNPMFNPALIDEQPENRDKKK